MKYYINYADKFFKKQQNFAVKMARLRGGFDRITAYSRKDIDKEFYERNKIILEQSRGGGYWLWKPYFISRKLAELNDGDYLFYSDSGAFFLKNIYILIKELEKIDQDIMGFELPLIEKQWTKKELFINMDCADEIYFNTNQIFASYILIRKSPKSTKFFKEYLEYGCNEINITDKYDNTIIQDKDFIDHRHDQSIFSLLYKKYKLRPFKDPSQFGMYPRGYSGVLEDNLEINKLYVLSNKRMFRHSSYNEKYNNILFHNRKGNPLKSFFRFHIKYILCRLGIFKGKIE